MTDNRAVSPLFKTASQFFFYTGASIILLFIVLLQTEPAASLSYSLVWAFMFGAMFLLLSVATLSLALFHAGIQAWKGDDDE